MQKATLEKHISRHVHYMRIHSSGGNIEPYIINSKTVATTEDLTIIAMLPGKMPKFYGFTSTKQNQQESHQKNQRFKNGMFNYYKLNWNIKFRSYFS